MERKAFNESEAREIVAGEKAGTILTRDGVPVRILAWDLQSHYNIAGAVMLGKDEYVMQWTREGKADFRSNVNSNRDLIIEVEGGGQ